MITLFFGVVVAGSGVASGSFREYCANLLSFDFGVALSNVKKEWRPVDRESLSNGPSDRPVLLEYSVGSSSRTTFVYGQAEEIELLPGYFVLKVTDRNGLDHLLDPSKISVRSIYEAPEKLDGELDLLLASKNREPVSRLDGRVVRKHLCEKLKIAKSDPEILRRRQFVDSRFRNQALMSSDVKQFRCLGSIGLAAALQTASLVSREMTSSGSWLHDHSSNFVYSIGYMAALDQCLQTLSVENRNKFLALTLGASIVGNVWEEVNIPQLDNHSLPLFNSHGRKVKTDPGDLASGVLGSLTYIAAIKVIEHYDPNFVFWDYCH